LRAPVNKWFAAAILVAATVGGGYYLLGGDGSDAPQKPSWGQVRRGEIVSVVSSTGRVVPALNVEIKCKASGEVVRITRDVSDAVTKGELLVELDPIDEQRRVSKAEIALSASRARVQQKKSALAISERNLVTNRSRAKTALDSARARAVDATSKAERVLRLLEKKLASQEEYDTAKTVSVQADAEHAHAETRLEELKTEELALEMARQDLLLAGAQVKSDEITLADARSRLSETKICAPISGVVSSRRAEIGQIVSSGINNIGGGTTLMSVADLNVIYVLAAVDESDIGGVKLDQEAVVSVDAYPDEVFDGRVARIATSGVSVSNVVSFEVRIEVTDPKKGLLKPEMTANIDIITAQKDDALLVPAEAVTKTSKGYFIHTGFGETEQTPRQVTIGIRNDSTIEVLDGVEEGEKVLLNSDGADSKWRSDDRRGPFGR
jgi:HlyD family secretion protein